MYQPPAMCLPTFRIHRVLKLLSFCLMNRTLAHSLLLLRNSCYAHAHMGAYWAKKYTEEPVGSCGFLCISDCWQSWMLPHFLLTYACMHRAHVFSADLDVSMVTIYMYSMLRNNMPVHSPQTSHSLLLHTDIAQTLIWYSYYTHYCLNAILLSACNSYMTDNNCELKLSTYLKMINVSTKWWWL